MSTARLTIDLDAIAANWRALDALSASTTETGATVKANAYGLGVAPVARALARAGCRSFFVAAAEEGAALREALGPGPRIFVYSGHMSGDTDMIGDLALIPLLNSIEQMTRHFEALPARPYGVQLDSGMNRLGLEPEEWAAVRDIARNPELVMSHLACADEPGHPMNAQQLQSFREMAEGVGAPLSLAATGGVLLGAEYHFDLTRPGIGLYGGLPFEDAAPAVTLSVPVVQTRELEEGEPVGYANAWIAEKPTRIATVSLGYADGMHRALAQGVVMFADDVPCPVVGRISMDLITVDITHLAQIPRTLDMICAHQTADDLAEAAGTIGYEILTSLGTRLARRHKGSGA